MTAAEITIAPTNHPNSAVQSPAPPSVPPRGRICRLREAEREMTEPTAQRVTGNVPTAALSATMKLRVVVPVAKNCAVEKLTPTPAGRPRMESTTGFVKFPARVTFTVVEPKLPTRVATAAAPGVTRRPRTSSWNGTARVAVPLRPWMDPGATPGAADGDPSSVSVAVPDGAINVGEDVQIAPAGAPARDRVTIGPA